MNIWDILKLVSIFLGCAAVLLWGILLVLDRKSAKKRQIPKWLPVTVFLLFLLYCLLRLIDSLVHYAP